MNVTENLNLNKPDLDDVVDITVLNENMDIIDEKFNELGSDVCELLAEYTLNASTKVITQPITEEMVYKFKSFFFKCTNKDAVIITTYFGGTILDYLPKNYTLNTQSLVRYFNTNLTINGTGTSYSNNLTFTPDTTRSNDLKVELYGVKYA